MFTNLYNLDIDLFDYLDSNSNFIGIYDESTITKTHKSDPDGCFCRSCKEFYQYAAPDNVVFDNKMTCWRCGTHIFRKYKGLPREKVVEIDVIYNNR